MADVSGHAGGARDIVQGQLADVGRYLQQALANSEPAPCTGLGAITALGCASGTDVDMQPDVIQDAPGVAESATTQLQASCLAHAINQAAPHANRAMRACAAR